MPEKRWGPTENQIGGRCHSLMSPMHSILALALSVASAQTVTFDGTQLTVTSQHQRQLPAEVDVLVMQIASNDPREWDAAIMTVSDAEARVRKVLEKEEPAALVRPLSQSATVTPPNGGSASLQLEIRLPVRAKTPLIASKLAMIRGVTSLTTTHDISDRPKALSDNRREALAAARAKAEDYANGIGRKLGKTLSLVENGESIQPAYAGLFLTANSTLTLKFAVE